MYIRCGACGTCTRAPLGGTVGSGLNCMSCGKRHSTAKAGTLGSTPRDRYERVQTFATQHKIDLASAYSVLLGILPLERALSLDEVFVVQNGTAEPPAPETLGEDSVSRRYDVAFADAVAAGLLTDRQAAERGDRVFYASRIARQHGLSMSLAFQIADNRMTLDEAMTRQADSSAREGLVEAIPERRVASGAAIAWAAVAFIAIAGGIVWRFVPGHASDGDAGSAPAASASFRPDPGMPVVPRAAAEIRLDASGRPLEVKAPDPESVLSAYCGASPQPVVRVPQRVVQSGDDYVGYYTESGIVYALRIRNEPGGFAAGSVSQPAQPEPQKPSGLPG